MSLGIFLFGLCAPGQWIEKTLLLCSMNGLGGLVPGVVGKVLVLQLQSHLVLIWVLWIVYLRGLDQGVPLLLLQSVGDIF